MQTAVKDEEVWKKGNKEWKEKERNNNGEKTTTTSKRIRKVVNHKFKHRDVPKTNALFLSFFLATHSTHVFMLFVAHGSGVQ